MASRTLWIRSSRTLFQTRPFAHSSRVFSKELNERGHSNAEEHRKAQTQRPLNPGLSRDQSAEKADIPKVGKDKAPPELISSVEKNAGQGGSSELNVGEIEGGTFRVEPLRRTGEDPSTMRARLLYQSRKRGTLESDLLLSTFADTYLRTMSPTQLQQYDLFLDENDWDIYYWATQEPTPTSAETAEGAQNAPQADQPVQSPRPGEWAQTVGTFKPAYRPVPARWKESEVLELLRDHVENKRKDGMAFMPPLKSMV